jgi:hypothetical protein
MSIKTIFKEIRRTLTIWTRIDEPPRWVRHAHSHVSEHFEGDKYYSGKNHLYKVHMEEHGHGQHTEEWFIKKRVR